MFQYVLPVIISLIIPFTAGSPVFAGENADRRQALHQELETYFENMGFADYAKQMRESLIKNKDTLRTVNRQTLEMSAERYDNFNHAREIAIQVIEKLYQSSDYETLRDIVMLTAKLMAQKPVAPPSKWPEDIASMPEKPAEALKLKQDKQREFIVRKTVEEIRTHAQVVMSDVAKTLYGSSKILTWARLGGTHHNNQDPFVLSLHNLDERINSLVAFQYLDGEMGDNLLAQALVLALAKFGADQVQSLRERKIHATLPVMEMLSSAARKRGEDVGAYIGDEARFVDRRHGEIKIKIKSGMIIGERAAIYPQESSELAWAARPGGFSNWVRATWLNFLGGPVGMLVGTEEVSKSPSISRRVRLYLQMLPLFNRGLSHAGWAYVFRDTKTGLKRKMAVDIYPGLEQGGIRILRLEKFASRGVNLRFATAEVDARKFRGWAKEQIENGRINMIAWDGVKEVTDEKGETIKEKSIEPENWVSNITPEEVKARFYKYTDNQAEEWFQNEVIEPAMGRVFKFLTESGLAFAVNFTNYTWRSYCSKLVALSVKLESGFDIQLHPDSFNLIGQIAYKAGLVDSDLKQRIVAPGGLFWQSRRFGTSGLTKNVVINFPDDGNFEQRIAMQFGELEPAVDQRTTKALQQLGVLETNVRVAPKYTSEEGGGLLYLANRAIDSHYKKARKASVPSVFERAGVQGRGHGFIGFCRLVMEMDPRN